MPKIVERRISCHECGCNRGEFDGYDFADRLLEGVRFQAWVENSQLKVEVKPGRDAEFFENFNRKKWLAEALAHVEGLDVLDCPGCGEEITGPYWWGKPDPLEEE